MRLAVELYGSVIGMLEGEAKDFDFTPNEEGIDRFGANSLVLSVAVPLSPLLRRDHAARRRNWFGELLPEGDQYDYMIAQSSLRRDDTPSFLAHYGRDVAGALQLWDADNPHEPTTPSLRELNPEQVRAVLQDPIGSPLANEPGAGKSSLGGVQPKIVLVQTESGWAQALGGHPTTHILKPQLAGNRATVIFDEEYGSRIARRMGLAEFGTSVQDFAGLPALVIERYDRVDGLRVHQEDFNQALGARGNEKYQEMGGVVSLKRVAHILQRQALHSDLQLLARMVVLAVGIGNLDMHTKNISLLHSADGRVSLAPAYDVVPQLHMPNDGKLALAVNKRYRHDELTRGDLLSELASWGLKGAAELIDRFLGELEQVVNEEIPLEGAYPHLQSSILGFLKALR